MDRTSNKATIRRFHDASNSRDAELMAKTIDELVAPDAVIRTPVPIEGTGAQKLKAVFTTLRRAYPDLRVAIEDLIEEGDKVVSRNTVTGTHRVTGRADRRCPAIRYGSREAGRMPERRYRPRRRQGSDSREGPRAARRTSRR